MIPQKELKTKWEKYDLPKAKELMAAAGFSKGFDITLTTFSTPLDFPAMAALIQNQLKEININVNIVAQDPATFAANNGKGAFEMDLTARGMRGDVDGYIAEFNPTRRVRQDRLQHLVQRLQEHADVAARRQRADHARPEEAHADVPEARTGVLMTELLEIPLVSVSKYQVVNTKLQDMYVAFTDFNTGPPDDGLAGVGATRGGAVHGAAPPHHLTALHRFLAQRFASMIATLVAVSIVIFSMVRLLPGNIIDIMFGGDATAIARGEGGRRAAARPRRLVPVAVLALGQRDLPRRHGQLAAEQPPDLGHRCRPRCRSRSS